MRAKAWRERLFTLLASFLTMSTPSKKKESIGIDAEAPQHTSFFHRQKRLTALLAVVIAGVSVVLIQSRQTYRASEEPVCRPPLPDLLFKGELDLSHSEAVKSAIKDVNAEFSSFFEKGGIDSISLAVVTPFGSIYESFWGTLRANESKGISQETVNRDTIYRLASISKVFTTMESYILRDRLFVNL